MSLRTFLPGSLPFICYYIVNTVSGEIHVVSMKTLTLWLASLYGQTSIKPVSSVVVILVVSMLMMMIGGTGGVINNCGVVVIFGINNVSAANFA